MRARPAVRDRLAAAGVDPDREAARIVPYAYLHAALQEVALAESGCEALVDLALQRAVRGLQLRGQAEAAAPYGARR